MPYELFVAWRYVYRERRSAIMWIAVAIALIPLVVGAVLFGATSAKATGAVTLAIGGVLFITTLLLALFTTFAAIAVLGLAIGSAILIWVLSVTSGFQTEFRNKVLGVNAHILVLKYGISFANYREVMDKAKKMDGVVAVAPFLFNEMMIARGNRLSGVLVKGVDPKLVGRVLSLPKHIIKPRRICPETRDCAPGAGAAEMPKLLTATPKKHKAGVPTRLPGLVLGAELAKKLGARVGDPVRLISPLSGLDVAGWSADVDLPRSRDFRIAAIFDSGFDEYDKRLVYVHMSEAQAFFDHGDVVTGVEMKVRDVYRARAMSKALYAALGGSPYRIVDWSELNHNLFTALNWQKIFLSVVVGGFLAVVVCFNVVAALAMMVIRKGREIAILKSMGSSSLGVARVFVACGSVVWAAGASIGVLGGYLGALLLRRYGFPLDAKVYLIRELPVRMDPVEFVLVVGVSLVVVLAAALYPAIRAAQLEPVSGLQRGRK
ncbi:MAG: ABC transporter permease [Myxococcales bacterium]|nr:ABC transporter permease [Myxococcales bacterium]